MLKELYFGKYYFEMAMFFRRSMFLNGMLFSIESLYGIKNTHIAKLGSCDKILSCPLYEYFCQTSGCVEYWYSGLGYFHTLRVKIDFGAI